MKRKKVLNKPIQLCSSRRVKVQRNGNFAPPVLGNLGSGRSAPCLNLNKWGCLGLSDQPVYVCTAWVFQFKGEKDLIHRCTREDLAEGCKFPSKTKWQSYIWKWKKQWTSWSSALYLRLLPHLTPAESPTVVCKTLIRVKEAYILVLVCSDRIINLRFNKLSSYVWTHTKFLERKLHRAVLLL